MNNAEEYRRSSPLEPFVSVGRMQGVSEIQNALRAIHSGSAMATKSEKQQQ